MHRVTACTHALPEAAPGALAVGVPGAVAPVRMHLHPAHRCSRRNHVSVNVTEVPSPSCKRTVQRDCHMLVMTVLVRGSIHCKLLCSNAG